MPESISIGIVGAESTGKTTLAADLAAQLQQISGLPVAWVPEVLRQWCQDSGRTPLAHEQASILRTQHQRIATAARSHPLVVCDTTALMTAVYSRLLFGDRTLDERAALVHRRSIHITLLTAIDLPWQPDGFLRDGPQVQEPVDRMLRELMQAHGIGFAVVGGQGPTRLAQAVAAVQALLGAPSAGEVSKQHGSRADPTEHTRLTAGSGLFSGLSESSLNQRGWSCECCLPDQERALRRLQSNAQ